MKRPYLKQNIAIQKCISQIFVKAETIINSVFLLGGEVEGTLLVLICRVHDNSHAKHGVGGREEAFTTRVVKRD